MEKFLCPSRKSLEDMSFEAGRDFFAKTDGKLIKRGFLKINGKKNNGGFVNAFHFKDDLSFNQDDLSLVFIDEKFCRCLEDFLSDQKTLSIIIDVEEVKGYVSPKVKHRMTLVSRVISKKNLTKDSASVLS
ncbi:MAG: hypothetical protein WCY43_00835 [Patescibacteria group bacterium]|nr:hypothetical protein [Patescibacteria group bacterium]